jgi:Glycosyltransferase family 87
MQAISHELATPHDALRGGAPGLERAGRSTWRTRFTRSAQRPAAVALTVLSWLIPLAFVAWAARLVFLEGYLYEIPGDFLGDFTRTAQLGAPTWWTGEGLFYGPIFVLEFKYLVESQIMSNADFARLDFLLFGVAFGCVWLALFGLHRPRLAIFVLAGWLANHMTVEAFANTAHLEILELALISVGLLLVVRGFNFAAGGALGLAIATKVLPAVFLPYLAITRRWRLLLGAVVFAAVPFFAVCWLQGISPVDGLYALVYQGGNLTKLEYSEYEYTPRAEIARMLAGEGGTLSAEQAQLAIALHWVIAIATASFAAWVLYRSRIAASTYGLMFGVVAVVMLVAAPSAHAPYYVFLLPAWTALLADLVRRPLSGRTVGFWAALVVAYTFTGFDQPFFLSQRLFGFGIVVPQHWLAWHLPTLGLLLTLSTLTALLLNARPVELPDQLLSPRGAR